VAPRQGTQTLTELLTVQAKPSSMTQTGEQPSPAKGLLSSQS
jgi:hypothetical protein